MPGPAPLRPQRSPRFASARQKGVEELLVRAIFDDPACGPMPERWPESPDARPANVQIFSVAAELRYGAAKKKSSRLTTQIEAVFSVLEILPFEMPADAIYGSIRSQFESAGTLIGGNNMMIAAQVIALGCTLVTDNVGEFSRVSGLRHENWLCPGCWHPTIEFAQDK